MAGSPDIVVTEAEQALGFSVQTLTYPEGAYELPDLRPGVGTRLDRTAALVIDDGHRFRRRHAGAGYMHEQFNGRAWEAAGLFESLADLAGSDLYRRYVARRDAESAANEPPE
jgi:hypothetical protein